MQVKKIIKALEDRHPYYERADTKSENERQKYRRQGYDKAIELLNQIHSQYKHEHLLPECSLHFLTSAYGMKWKQVNEYHVKLYHDEYEGWFDWYYTTGTVIANRNGDSTNLGKYKNDEELALKITKHIYE